MTTTHPMPTPAEEGLDDTLSDAFPASDPPPSIPAPEPTAEAHRELPSPGIPRRRWTDRLREQGIELDVH